MQSKLCWDHYARELIEKSYVNKLHLCGVLFVCSGFCLWEKPLISLKLSETESWALILLRLSPIWKGVISMLIQDMDIFW